MHAVVAYTNQLEKLRKSALPGAVRGTLNSAAFDVKQRSMPASAEASFKNRQPNFFRANSKVDMATGNDIDTMKATVGFVEGGLRGGNNYAVRDLEQQEHGGIIDKKSFVPTDASRKGGKLTPVRPINQLGRIKKMVNVNKKTGNSKQKYFGAATDAGRGGFILTKNALLRVKSFTKKKLKTEMVYDYKQGRKVKVKETSFMRDASLRTGARLKEFYVKEAKRQLGELTRQWPY